MTPDRLSLDGTPRAPHLEGTFMSIDLNAIGTSALKARLAEMRRYL